MAADTAARLKTFAAGAEDEVNPQYNAQVAVIKNQLAENKLAYAKQKTSLNTNYDTQVTDQNRVNSSNKTNYSNVLTNRGLGRSSIAATGLAEMDQVNSRNVGTINTSRTGALNSIDASILQNSNAVGNTLTTMAADRQANINTVAKNNMYRQDDIDYRDSRDSVNDNRYKTETATNNSRYASEKAYANSRDTINDNRYKTETATNNSRYASEKATDNSRYKTAEAKDNSRYATSQAQAAAATATANARYNSEKATDNSRYAQSIATAKLAVQTDNSRYNTAQAAKTSGYSTADLSAMSWKDFYAAENNGTSAAYLKTNGSGIIDAIGNGEYQKMQAASAKSIAQAAADKKAKATAASIAAAKKKLQTPAKSSGGFWSTIKSWWN